MPAFLLSFRARTPIRDALRRFRRWLSYRPERAYMRAAASRREVRGRPARWHAPWQAR